MPATVRTRRRFIGITAAVSALAMTPGALRLAHAVQAPLGEPAVAPLTWSGIALGADAEMRLYHPDPRTAQHLLESALAEIERLENLFSLYREDSALARLNRQGYLDNPPADLLRLLTESAHYSRLTRGAFDPSVQPLWRLYAEHFAHSGADPAGPAPAALRNALERVGYQAVLADPQRIQLRRGMALTLNGIAQGYITDRITDLLRTGGLDRALVDLGEVRGLHTQAAGTAPQWRVGLAWPQTPSQVHTTVEIRNQALATSSGRGTPLDPAGRHTHLFDPHTGLAQPLYQGVSVLAPTATMADALSTAFSIMAPEQTAPVVRKLGLRAWFVLEDGRVREQQGQPPAQT
ncbi:FAD:protein FMN transferase [Bordetella petrii]|uniref:FAD:protein FMN transferase n=1 Tax=Bordetella petrii TaxID=94624 RepID=UPI001E569830|nr:FAD:protein FMN transferase [Bordetella petrii]MCD0503670.1 FAD:protein FMN transferase [Bordetella petrii]